MESSKKTNQISDTVKVKQLLKNWRKQANSSSTTNANSNKNNNNNNKSGSLSRSNSIKGGITFLRRTLSLNDISMNVNGDQLLSNAVPKGFLAVHVGLGEEMKRTVIPTNYLSHQAFTVLLKQAEEEFGFQQEGILRIPCEVEVFESILKTVESKKSPHSKQALWFKNRKDSVVCGSSQTQSLSQSHHPPTPMCRCSKDTFSSILV